MTLSKRLEKLEEHSGNGDRRRMDDDALMQEIIEGRKEFDRLRARLRGEDRQSGNKEPAAAE